ncbi:poly-gamma-glutamate hydrolase family protein [Priestia aryabhattai]|uniref:poly-gamma-glutamate hydrolase family protein n=1 Tax=Priestia aryabhattai TaxID=412384 RepID=UPI0035322AA8
MVDTYRNFAELSASEVYGIDYQIAFSYRLSNKTIVAIHGGGIETGISELAMNIAGLSHSCYLFEGLKSSDNGTLHITSTNFDEPNALNMAAESDYCLSLHGYADTTRKHTLIGGADHDVKLQVYNKLIATGFSAELLDENDRISGSDPNNIVNKTKRRMGVQLEISTLQRNSFFGINTRADRKNTQTEEFYRYTQVLKDVFGKLV